jgi:nucleotide-binding universal stress UspA family protein
MHKLRILVPVSFGEQSVLALKQAKTIAQRVHAMITCLHIIEKPGLVGSKLISRETEQKVRRESELKLASKAHGILSGEEEVPYELIISSGKVSRKILEKASELGMDMIIMGRSESARGKKNHLGSNAAQVIESADIPVLSIRNSPADPCGHLLVPLDLSVPVGVQLARTIDLAEILNARLTICTILHPGASGLESAYKRRLIEIKKLCTHYDILCRVKLIITKRRVAEELLSCSQRYQTNLLVLMTQNEEKTEHLSMGSVAHEILCKSEIPVLSMTPVIQRDLYPYRSLFGSINHPIDHPDLKDQLIRTR